MVGAPSRALPATHRSAFFSRRFALAACVAFMTLAAAGILWWQSPGATTYATAVGEQRTLTLTDGSTVELDSRSAIRVRYVAHERDIDLLQGQALFHVAKDHTRPFIVSSDGTQVRAVGTQFDVYRKPEGTVVTVLEGRVAVTNAAVESDTTPEVSPDGAAGAQASSSIDSPTSTASSRSALVSAGEQVTLAAQIPPKPVHTNVAVATAWTQHQLVLDAMQLVDVAAEFNRYSARKLIVEDSSVHPLRLSGVFSTDPEFLIRYLQARTDVSVQESRSEIRIVRKE